jgi:hypothetical protein
LPPPNYLAFEKGGAFKNIKKSRIPIKSYRTKNITSERFLMKLAYSLVTMEADPYQNRFLKVEDGTSRYVAMSLSLVLNRSF